nr:hypothetical protein [Tanacetum cinerariifolium]
MGEPLSPDRVFDFLMDEPDPHPAYDFFAPGSLPGCAGNPNNNNRWIEVDVPLLGELGAEADEPMVGLLVDEIVKAIVDMEGQSFTLPTPGFPVPPSVIEDLSTRMGNLEYGHGQLVKKVIQVSDVEVAEDITIREIGPRVSAIEGQVQVITSQMVQTVDTLKHVGAQVEQGQ